MLPAIGFSVMVIRNMYLEAKIHILEKTIEELNHVNHTYTQVYGNHVRTGLYNAKGREVL